MTWALADAGAIAAIFDWDGVIIDSRDQHARAWHALGERLGQPLPSDFIERTFGLRNEAIIPSCTTWAREGETARIAELGERKEEIYRELIRREGIAALPGARELVAALRAAGVPCAVGTSTPRANVDAILALIGLQGAFAAIVAAEDVQRGKPDPEVFLRCARSLRRAPARCAVFEDAHVGIAAARAGGMKAVAVATTHPAASFRDADLVVPDLAAVDVGAVWALFGG